MKKGLVAPTHKTTVVRSHTSTTDFLNERFQVHFTHEIEPAGDQSKSVEAHAINRCCFECKGETRLWEYKR